MAPPPDDYVLDATVVIQHLIREANTPAADALFDRLGASTQLHVPAFCFVECANVLWKRVRFHGLPAATAATLLSNLLALPLAISPSTTLLPAALALGIHHTLSVYDALYIALAQERGCPLVTEDRRQADVARALGVLLVPLTAFTPPPTTPPDTAS